MTDEAPHEPVAADAPPLIPTRRLLARHLVGNGIELGPGHAPFSVCETGTTVQYIDRWHPRENESLFPELNDATFVKPDIVADLNIERLTALHDASQDFVICSHVLEHVAEPIGLVADVYRVLRPGGIALILLPDRHRTFDRNRAPTPLDHLVAEFEAGVTEVDAQHLEEFVEHTGGSLGTTEAERAANIALHLNRSIHVHCWDDEEFLPVALYGIRNLGQRWEFVDGMIAEDDGPTGMEFGFVLRVCGADVTGEELTERFTTQWHLWRSSRLAQAQAVRDRRECETRRREALDELSVLRARLDRIERRLPFRAFRFGRKLLRRR
jgi:SAM-dependent methyltransferase